MNLISLQPNIAADIGQNSALHINNGPHDDTDTSDSC